MIRAQLVARSPHARGCTAWVGVRRHAGAPFPACAGMHRTPLIASSHPPARSPHARGCTAPLVIGHPDLNPFPACAGMHRASCNRPRSSPAVPRMRGDAPQKKRVDGEIAAPFPACAGMHRWRSTSTLGTRTVPRMRGDAPATDPEIVARLDRSPHARGCTAGPGLGQALIVPFPACAGMHRFRSPPRRQIAAVPRMRGDAPHCRSHTRRLYSVPRMRGDAPHCARAQ